jgi:uncharacterized membrane protein YhdT
MAPPERRTLVTPHLVLGVLALVAGVLLLAGNLGFAPAAAHLRYWPVALLVIGAAKLIQAASLAGTIGGMAWLVIGAWLLANSVGVLRVTLWQAAAIYWPVLLVVLGLSIVRQTIGRRRDDDRLVDRRDELHIVAILGGNKASSGSHQFRGGELTAILGGVNLDLTQARLANGRAVLEVFTMWGGLELRLPEGWIVENHMMVALGGYEDRTRPVGSHDAPRLVLRGTTLMGGIEVRN